MMEWFSRNVFSLRRLLAMLAKEFVQMRRDRVTFAMMLGIPLMQLLLFGFAINNDPKRLPTALVALSDDQYARALASAMEVSGYFRFVERPETQEAADAALASGRVSFVVTIPSDFGTRIARGETARALVEADATDPAAASGAVGALQTIAARALGRAQGLGGKASAASIDLVVHRKYNPAGVSQYNIVPGLLGVILQMTMTVMTSVALTREIERGTMENLLALPATGAEIMLGKILPFFVVGAVQVVVVLVAAKLIFSTPFVGGLGLLLFSILIFVFALVLLGYAFSTFARTQMQAMQLTFFFFLPSILLSGFMFPFAGMPAWAQAIGEVFPLTHFLRIVRAVMLKGATAADVAAENAWLLGFLALYAGLALLRFRRTLD